MGRPIFSSKYNKNFENINLFPDLSKSKKLLNFENRVTLDAGLRKLLSGITNINFIFRGNMISIIMNCYNGEVYLKQALKSVLNQTYKDWELIFWDNMSSDASAKIFKSVNDKRFKYYLSDHHDLLYAARNKAISKQKEIFSFPGC